MDSDLRTMNEEELRNYKVPYVKTKEELDEIIQALTEREQDYGTCVYAMSITATATFNFVASKLGVTGFQASCADMDILRRTRNIERFQIVNYEDYMYPQYDLIASVQEGLDGQKDYFAEKAKALLADLNPEYPAHPDVVAHWEKLANA